MMKSLNLKYEDEKNNEYLNKKSHFEFVFFVVCFRDVNTNNIY